jgi:hypothetical protein
MELILAQVGKLDIERVPPLDHALLVALLPCWPLTGATSFDPENLEITLNNDN